MIDDARLDLRTLDAGDDAARTESLLRSVMAEIERRPRDGGIRELRRYRAALLAAAAVFVAVAFGATRIRRAPRLPAADVVAEWARGGRVPTNGELITAYQGYRP